MVINDVYEKLISPVLRSAPDLDATLGVRKGYVRDTMRSSNPHISTVLYLLGIAGYKLIAVPKEVRISYLNDACFDIEADTGRKGVPHLPPPERRLAKEKAKSEESVIREE